MKNILFDCAASIVTDKDFDQLSVAELVHAMKARLDRILEANDHEAFGFCDSDEE